ncbi:DUF7373 family lipoprotein [Nocardia xishanensis]|uniref:DUF7373 family lipoprotein n=1 Tax=Nocardia xishanensis TaxID=238964 RepID=UPI001FE12832|nr:hypothetical protein [Nocardia xishanensis]
MAITAALAFTASACGAEVSGRAVRVEADTSGLDVGNYRTEPREIGNAKSSEQARAREAQRLADYVALPYEADQSYVEDSWHLRPHIVLNRKTLGNLVINDTFDEVAKDLVTGWVNAWSTGGASEDKRRTMNLAVLMFPDAQTAQGVGPALERDDFTYNRDNQPVSITKHPNTSAHWRPTVSSIGSWTVHDRYVIFIKVVDDTSLPDLPALTSQVERMLDVQIPLLQKFAPTPADQLARIPLDPYGILGRTLPSDPESPSRPEPDGFYTGRGSLPLLANPDQTTLGELEKAGIELISFGDAVIFRSKSSKGAESLWKSWRPSTHLESDEKLLDAPAGLGSNAECEGKYYNSLGIERMAYSSCVFQVDRYIILTRAEQVQDLHQKTSAQYVLLTRK